MLPERIETGRLTLRPFRGEDVEAVFDYSADPEWARFQNIPIPYHRTDAEAWVAQLLARDWSLQPTWAICRDGQVVGIVALAFEPEHGVAVLGYGVHRTLWGQGFSVEAARAVLDSAFAHRPDLRRIRAHTHAANAASHRVLAKLGFRHEGTLRANKVNRRGEVGDEAVFGLLREEWRRPASLIPAKAGTQAHSADAGWKGAEFL